MSHAYEVVANFLKANTTYRPEVGIICGSGLSGLSKSLENSKTFKYEDIPGFPCATVAGHAGELVFGTIGGIQCVCMRGRFHYYEGNSMEQVILPVRVMRLMGVKLLVVTNAAGGLNPSFNVGDIMVIQDHFGLVSLLLKVLPLHVLFSVLIAKSFFISLLWQATTLLEVSMMTHLVLAFPLSVTLTTKDFSRWCWMQQLN